MTKRRILWIVAALAALGLALGAGVVIGGGVVYALARGGDRLPLAVAERGDPGHGIVVAFVEADGPADRAGIARGDILLELDGETIEAPRDLLLILEQLKAGDEVELVVLHGDEERTLTVTLGENDGRAYLGLSPCGGYDASLQVHLSSSGALIVEVTPDSPAEEVGLQVGDTIVAVDGQSLGEADLAALIAEHKAGDTVSLTVERPGADPSEITVTLGSNPENEDLAYLGLQYVPSPGVGMWHGGPLLLGEYGDWEWDELPFSIPEGDLAGVVVQRVIEDSPALAAGIKESDVITAIDGEPVESAQALVEAVAAHKPGDQIVLTLFRSGEEGERKIEVTLGEHPEEDGKAYLGVWLGGFFRMHKSQEDEGMSPRRWFFGFPSDENDLPGGQFEFHWPPGHGVDETPWSDGTDSI